MERFAPSADLHLSRMSSPIFFSPYRAVDELSLQTFPCQPAVMTKAPGATLVYFFPVLPLEVKECFADSATRHAESEGAGSVEIIVNLVEELYGKLVQPGFDGSLGQALVCTLFADVLASG